MEGDQSRVSEEKKEAYFLCRSHHQDVREWILRLLHSKVRKTQGFGPTLGHQVREPRK